MIISHSHNFIFVRIPKNGSSTTQVLLADSGLACEGDIVTHVKGLKFKPTLARMGHANFSQMIARGYITPNMLDGYEVVMTLRNPISRFKSAYMFLNSQDDICASHYRNEVLNSDVVRYKGLQSQKSFCTFDGALQYATVFDFDNLYDDVCKFIVGKGCTPIEEVKLKAQSYPDYITNMDNGLLQVLTYKLNDEIEHYNKALGR